MKLVNGFYVDEYNNRWTASENTLESAIEKSKTLKCCADCTDCWNCAFCQGCELCKHCANCSLCTACESCTFCQGCEQCDDCKNCINCTACGACVSCNGCAECTRCHASNRCSKCASCRHCTGCRLCNNCISCTACTDCAWCRSCRDCDRFYKNPQRYLTPRIGSRDSHTQVYWVSPDNVQVICGCFKGNLAEFKKAVVSTHGTNIFAREYLEQIEIIERLVTGIKTKE